MNSRTKIANLTRAAAAALALTTLPAAATTISEGSVPGGDFSSSFSAPTAIGFGNGIAAGEGRPAQFGFFLGSGHRSGAWG